MLRRSATLQWQFQSLRAAKPSEQNGAQTATLPTLPSFVSGWVQGIKSILSDSAVQAAKAGIKSGEYEAYAASQINYMLGDNPNNFSYVIGYGDSFPKQPHHKVNII